MISYIYLLFLHLWALFGTLLLQNADIKFTNDRSTRDLKIKLRKFPKVKCLFDLLTMNLSITFPKWEGEVLIYLCGLLSIGQLHVDYGFCQNFVPSSFYISSSLDTDWFISLHICHWGEIIAKKYRASMFAAPYNRHSINLAIPATHKIQT